MSNILFFTHRKFCYETYHLYLSPFFFLFLTYFRANFFFRPRFFPFHRLFFFLSLFSSAIFFDCPVFNLLVRNHPMFFLFLNKQTNKQTPPTHAATAYEITRYVISLIEWKNDTFLYKNRCLTLFLGQGWNFCKCVRERKGLGNEETDWRRTDLLTHIFLTGLILN